MIVSGLDDPISRTMLWDFELAGLGAGAMAYSALGFATVEDYKIFLRNAIKGMKETPTILQLYAYSAQKPNDK